MSLAKKIGGYSLSQETSMLFATVTGLFASALAIDVGTANTVVYMHGQGIVACEPSVVAVQEHRDGTYVPLGIGQPAKAMIGKGPCHVTTTRPIRHGKVADCVFAKIMLKHFLQRAMGRKSLRPLRVILNVSPASSAVERRAIVEVAEAAGAHAVSLIYEPVAAALGAGLAIREPYGHMLVDIGGGTTDIAVISLAELVYSKTLQLGGETLDAAIARMLRCKYNFEIGEQTAEQVKITLGSVLPCLPIPPMAVKGVDSTTGAPRLQEVTAHDIRQVLLEPVDTMLAAIRQAFDTLSPELVADIADGGLTLTGGGALLHGLGPYMSDALGFPVRLATEPMACVALGAGGALTETALCQQVTMHL
jgi:rod shape-determining protein MreB